MGTLQQEELQQSILQETQELSFELLHEVLDFVQFIKKKQLEKKQAFAWENDLTLLNENSLLHLEQEFLHYKEEFPHE